jgi:sirohydrochlorin cobaltochelatase
VQASNPDLRVHLAFLEFMRPALREVLEDAGKNGYTHACIAPLFLGTGGHLLRDVPLAVQEVQQRYPALKIEIAPPAGGEVEVLAALSAYAGRCAVVT